jgi:hypothetical protein
MFLAGIQIFTGCRLKTPPSARTEQSAGMTTLINGIFTISKSLDRRELLEKWLKVDGNHKIF